MKKILLTLTMAIGCTIAGFAQTPPQRNCGTMQHHEFLKQTRPAYATDLNQYNQLIENYLQDKAAGLNASKTNNSAAIITIPVVVHVIYRLAGENISDAQAVSQVQVLNDDFAKLNADAIKVTQPTFSTAASGAQIRFCLAQRDPNGNPTTGVTHKTTTVTAFTTNDAVKSNATGGQTAWDVTKYVNIWVCNLGTTLLGYGEFPTATLSNTWGLVLNYRYTGSGGSAQAPFNLGRTGTHEFGHCFNLFHIWGDDNGACTGSDQCADTPNQANSSGGTFPAGSIQTDACSPTSPGYMWMNYMDYTDDAAMYMFTAGQVARMEAVVNNPPWNVLATSLGCTPVSALDAGITSVIDPQNGSSSCNTSVTPKITLNNAGSTTLTSATINYQMDATATQTLAWTGSLASTASTVVTLNTYSGLTNAAHTFSVWVTSPNGGTDGNAANNSLSSNFTVVAVPPGAALPFTERFDAATFPPAGWVETNVNVADAAFNWTRVANTTGIPVVPVTAACAKMDNFAGNIDISGQKDALRTPALNLTGANSTLRVVFDRSHRMYSTTDIDSLNIYISTDCGGSWTRLYTKGGAQLATVAGTLTTAYTPTSNAQWARDSVSLGAYVGQASVYLKFESRSGWGNNLYLDNINVKFTPSTTPPVATFTSAATKCAGSSIAFTDASTNSPTSWNWSFPGATTTTSTVQNPTATYTASGIYTVTLISANASGTSTPVSSTISVNASPTVAVTSATVCSGTGAVITASGATAYSWNTGATTASISVTPTTTTNYTVTGTNAAGCSNTRTTSVTVNITPTVAVSNATICSGAAANLTATGANTYSWNTGASTASISVSPTVTTNYTVTGMSAAGCLNTRTVSVTVNTTPVVAVGNATICSGTSAALVASGATTYNWNTGATTASISVAPTTTTNYTVTGTTVGCSDTKTVSVTVNSSPTVTATGGSICTGASANLTASGATSYVWNPGSLSGASVVVSPTATTIYTVTGTSVGCSNTNTVSVTVNGLPNVTATSATICAGATATITAAGASTYTWNTGANGANLMASPASSTNYTVTASSAAGCVNTATATIIVGSAPAISVNSATICSGGTTTLTATGVTTYTWNTTSNASSISVSPTGTTVYTVTGNLSGCATSASQTATVTVNSTPNVTATGGSICTGASANLTASGATSYVWNPGSLAGSTVVVSPTATTIYTVTGTSVGCSNSNTVSVTVNGIPNVTATSASICAGATATITAAGASTYTWNTGANGANLMASPASSTNYTVTATSAAGCVNTATATIVVGSAPSISVNSAIICAGGTTTLTASGVTTYTWNTTSNASSISVSPTGTTVYTVTGNLNGCAVSASQTATVTVNSIPVVNLGAIAGPLCTNNAPVALSGSPSGGIFSGTGVVGSTFDPSVSGVGTFTVMYNFTDGNGCSAVDTKTVDVSLCTGINELTNSSISVYPNPAKETVRITMSSSLVNNATIEIYDAIGKLIISEKVKNANTILSIADYAVGIYTIRVVSDSNQSIIKLIKE